MAGGNINIDILQDNLYESAHNNSPKNFVTWMERAKEYVKKISNDSIEYFGNMVMDRTLDWEHPDRNVFMHSVAEIPSGYLDESAFYKYLMKDNPDDYDTRVISLVGRMKDAKGQTIYDYLEKHCTDEQDKQNCVAVLRKIKEAMDKEADNGRPVLQETMIKFNECYNKIPDPKDAIEIYNPNKDTKEKMQTDAKVISLVSNLQMAIIENNYDNFNKALGQIQEYIDKDSGIVIPKLKTEEFAHIALSARADISGKVRNVFMLSLDNHIAQDGKFKDSVFYKFVTNYKTDNERDTRILSLLAQSKDGDGKTFFDHILKLNPRKLKDDDKNAYVAILLYIKRAMDKDEKNGHHIPSEIKRQYNICAREAGLWRDEHLYTKEYKEQIKELRKNNIKDPKYLISPYYNYDDPSNTDQRIPAIFNRISPLTEGFTSFWDTHYRYNGKVHSK